MVFDSEWFNQKQKTLIWLLNTPIIKIWFRWVMRIRLCDCKLSTKINRIEPNSFTFGGKRIGDKLELTTDFRTHNKYAKRLYYAFKPIWHLIHLWDTKFANEVIPALNMGFDTLTKYPDAHTETNTVDGHTQMYTDNQTWSQIRDGAGTEAYDSTATMDTGFASGSSGGFARMTRAIFLFDTSSLTSSATISAVVLSLYGNSKNDGASLTPDIDIYTSTPASNTALEASDFTDVGTTSQTGSPIAYADFSTAGYNAFTFSATGRGNVSKTGISKFGSRNANYDVANNKPTMAISKDANFRMYTADRAGTDNDPKLVVTYTLPSGNALVFGCNF